jgi:hypothetical protein
MVGLVCSLLVRWSMGIHTGPHPDVLMANHRKSWQSPLLAFVSVYTLASGLCLFAPDEFLRKLRSVAWLLGPPASLVYGKDYLWAVACGTMFVVIPLACTMRATTTSSRRVGTCLTVAAWCIAGTLAYAPGA